MTERSIILTGFDPFGGRAENPSQQIVDTIRAAHQADDSLIAEVLPTQFATAGARIRALLAVHRPAACIMLGLNDRADAIHLERVAVNFNACKIPDNAGDQPESRTIIADGPPSYISTLPLDRVAEQLAARAIPCRFSDSAGTFVCNHVFYSAAHKRDHRLGLPTRCGFIHVPPLTVLPLHTMVDAVRACLRIIRNLSPDSA